MDVDGTCLRDLTGAEAWDGPSAAGETWRGPVWPEHVREGEETGGRVLRMNKGGPQEAAEKALAPDPRPPATHPLQPAVPRGAGPGSI